MDVWKVFACCALLVPAAGCEVRPAVPVATVRLPPPPVLVAPTPVAVVPAAPVVLAPAYKPHPGRGLGHGKHGRWH